MLEPSRTPNPPEFNNAAGRLLSLLQFAFEGKKSLIQSASDIYGVKQGSDQQRAATALLVMLANSYDALLDDLQHSPKIPDASRDVFLQGLSGLGASIFISNQSTAIRQLPDAEVSLLRVIGSLLDMESELEDSDAEAIRTSLDGLRNLLEESNLSKSARVAMLELCSLSRSALDQYTIHGARGFKAAFKKMLAELMEVYLDDKEVAKETWFKSALEHAKLIDAVAGRLLKYRPLLENAATLFIGST